MKHVWKGLILGLIGGALYAGIELLWRGHTHWTMAVLGGVLFVLLGGINEVLPWDMPLEIQGIIGAGIVTAAELVAGLVLNRWLGLGIWDYGNLPGNVLGQICPQFTAAWLGLSIVAIVLDDWIRWRLWGEERPHYTTIFAHKREGKP